MEFILTANDLVKEFQMGETVVYALDHASFSVAEGEFVVILGPSGSGKSTSLNVIGGIDTLTGGELMFRDVAVHTLDKRQMAEYRRKYIGFVFQSYNLIPNLNVYENVNLAAQMSESPLDAEELINKVGLEKYKKHYPSRLSDSQQQLVAIARALCKNPDLLLCDEPTGALDSKTGAEILKLLSEFNREYRKTVVMATHDLNIARIADKVICFRDGKIQNVVINRYPL